MLDNITLFLDSVSEYIGIILAIVFIASIVDAAFGLGAILPGETVLVFAAVALRESPLLIFAVLVAAAGAFIGDHIGYFIGRKLGVKMVNTRMVRRIGVDRWDAATDFVKRRGFWLIIVARLLPGVRTLVAAAAGASPMSYRRFALASGTAAVIWSLLWVLGGGALGFAFVEFASHTTIPAIAVAVAAAVGFFVIRRRRRTA